MRILSVFLLVLPFCVLVSIGRLVSAVSVDNGVIMNSGFEQGLTGWLRDGDGFLGATSVNPHSGNSSLEISSSISQQADFRQNVSFSGTSFVFSFWVFRGLSASWTACYLAKDWDGNSARIVSSFVIQGNMIELNAWDYPNAPGRQMLSYDVAVGSWHNVTFMAVSASKSQYFYIDGNLVATLNSSSGFTFNPDILIFGDVSHDACNGVFYFDDFKLASLETTVPYPSATPSAAPVPTATPTSSASPSAPTPTLIISCKSSTSYSGFNVQLFGGLALNGTGIAGAPILLSYSVTGGKSWIDLTLVYTSLEGSYSAVWLPSVTGNYLLRATFEGNSDYSRTSTTASFAVSPIAEQGVFSVASNSTILEFTFTPNSSELRFGVSGPSGTTGYVNVYIPKSLMGNLSSLKVYVDGNQTEYTAGPQGDGWLLYFIYKHSTHVVTISLGSSLQTTEDSTESWMLYGIPLVIVLICIGVALVLRRRNGKQDVSSP